jgi:sorting nexin-9/18/33
VREARVEMAGMERELGYAILGMITSGISDPNTVEEEDEEDDSGGQKMNKKLDHSKGIVNSSGAWCWREDSKGKFYSSIPIPTCLIDFPECLHLTRGLQKFSNTLQSVADLYDDHVRFSLTLKLVYVFICVFALRPNAHN